MSDDVRRYAPNFGEQRRGVIAVALPLGSVEGIERLARDLIAFGFGMGGSAPGSSEQLEWHGKAEVARAALMENVKALTLRAERAEAERDTWKAHAVALGVHGEMERDCSRNILCLNMSVDRGVLELGGIDVLDGSLAKIRAQYKAALPNKPMEVAAEAFGLALADAERAKRPPTPSPGRTP